MSNNDLGTLGLPFCDVVLSSLSISPRVLTPAFDRYVTSYTAFEGPTAVTVTAANEHGAAIRFLDQDGAEIADGDTTSAGLQVDLAGGIDAIRVEVTSADGQAVHSYTISMRACAGAVADESNTGLVSDCEALLAARDALAGTATLNWSTGRPIAEWDGVTVGGTPERVTGLNLWNRNLDGRLPAELGSLSNLERLTLGRNQLTGAIPADLGKLANLTWLDLTQQPADGRYTRRSGQSCQPGAAVPLRQPADRTLYPRSWAVLPTWKSCTSPTTS